MEGVRIPVRDCGDREWPVVAEFVADPAFIERIHQARDWAGTNVVNLQQNEDVVELGEAGVFHVKHDGEATVEEGSRE